MEDTTYDVVLVGGGLQNALMALALTHRQPGIRLALVEREQALGGNHTWCFHEADVPPEAWPWVRPLVVQQWSGYQVCFPAYTRTLAAAYHAVSSPRLNDVVRAALVGREGSALLTGVAAAEVEPYRVGLSNGTTLRAELVVDARGPDVAANPPREAYQKFLGLELEVQGAVPAQPVLMDARVPQQGGYRFFYVLPLSDQRVLVEDTAYSDGPELDSPSLRAGVLDYAAQLGLQVRQVVRQETGVLPLPLEGAFPVAMAPGLLRGGYQGGWFHPTTGYSFPLAVRLANLVASSAAGQHNNARWSAMLEAQQRQSAFAVRLNRLLFGAFAAEDRRNVFERFYKLPQSTIRRFYALEMTHTDRARMFLGKPPLGVSIKAMLREVLP